MQNGSLVCYPLLTRGRTYGALWMNIPESRGQNFANMQTLANQAAIALERSILLSESRQQAKQIESAYAELEVTYDRTLTALMSALDARDRETEGHSTRVSRLACMLGEELGLNGYQLKSLERGSLLHDIGKIGISDTILHKPGKLTDDEWHIMRVHPDIGARIVEGIPFLQETLPVIRYHHERWDGSGYPLGLKGHEIPIQARIFAVADVFDALTSSRTYRKRSSAQEAVRYLTENSGRLFDPSIVQALTQLPYTDYIQGEKTSV
jgi:putative nucleotidyltransferase with HDIG domain